MEDRIGSIEVGKDGDIAIFKNHPLSIYGVPQMTIIDGKVYFDIKNDPDDMRMSVDPEEAMPAFYLEHEQSEWDRCMSDMYDLLSGAEHKH